MFIRSQTHAVYFSAGLNYQTDGIRELIFTSGSGLDLFKGFKDAGRKDVTRRNHQIAGGFFDVGFFDDIFKFEDVAAISWLGDTVMRHSFSRNFRKGNDRFGFVRNKTFCHAPQNITPGI